MMAIRLTIGIGGAMLSASLLATPAWAGERDAAAAEAFFQDGRTLMKQGNFAEACPKFEASRQLDPAAGTLLYLGECYEKLGKTASAWATFQTAADELANEPKQSQRAKKALERVRALAAKLSKLTVSVAPSARVPGLVVERNEVELKQATWGQAVPVDPGDYTISAHAPGKQDFVQRVTVAANSAMATIEVPSLQDAPTPTAADTPRTSAKPLPSSTAGAVAQPPDTPATIDQGATEHPGRTQRLIAYTAGGIGVAGLATGTVLGLVAKKKESQSADHCRKDDPTACTDPIGVDLRNSGHRYATAANIAFGVGAAGLVTGVVLYLTAPSGAKDNASGESERTAARLSIVPVVAERSSSLLVTGSF
jgi:serine/threonine-protein kinase